MGRQLLAACADVERVYSYAAKTVGFFIDSDELWKSYGSFLDSYPREGINTNAQGELAIILPSRRRYPISLFPFPNHLINSAGEFLDTILCVRR